MGPYHLARSESVSDDTNPSPGSAEKLPKPCHKKIKIVSEYMMKK